MVKGAGMLESLEEERLNQLKASADCYLRLTAAVPPQLAEVNLSIRLLIQGSLYLLTSELSAFCGNWKSYEFKRRSRRRCGAYADEAQQAVS